MIFEGHFYNLMLGLRKSQKKYIVVSPLIKIPTFNISGYKMTYSTDWRKKLASTVFQFRRIIID